MKMNCYKVVRSDLTSLGLYIKNKPIALVPFKIGEWTYPLSPKGGLFVTKDLTGVSWLRDYISHKKKTIPERSIEFALASRVFTAEYGKIIKPPKKPKSFMLEVDSVKLLEEIHPEIW
jgi:uncharacterized protein YigE (DUF2233 family)